MCKIMLTRVTLWRKSVCTRCPRRWPNINPLTAGVAYTRVFFFYDALKYHILNMLKINQQDLKRVDLNLVKSE